MLSNEDFDYLFVKLKEIHYWIKSHEKIILRNIKNFYNNLPDDNEAKKNIQGLWERLEMVPGVEKKFKITPTHETFTSIFMNQVFNGYCTFILYYLDDVFPYVIYNQSEIPEKKFNKEEKMKLKLLQNCMQLISLSPSVHFYFRKQIKVYVMRVYFTHQYEEKLKKEEQLRMIKERRENAEKAGKTCHYSQTLSSASSSPHSGSPNLRKVRSFDNLNQEKSDEILNPFKEFKPYYLIFKDTSDLEQYLDQFMEENYFTDYAMLFNLLEDELGIDMFEHID